MGKRKLQHFHIYLVLCWLYKIYIPPNATFDPTYTHALDACVPDDYYPCCAGYGLVTLETCIGR
jgi:hypothetical protein